MKVWPMAALLIAGACAAPAAKAPTPAPTPPAPAPIAPPPVSPPPVAQATPAPVRDACGAEPLQYLIGKPRTDIPVPLEPGRRRVVCSTCPVTQDYVPYRLTIVWDSTTGLVTQVRCG